MLKKESDSLQYEVNREKQECTKHIRLLESTKKLIQAREHQSTTRGAKVDNFENTKTLKDIGTFIH